MKCGFTTSNPLLGFPDIFEVKNPPANAEDNMQERWVRSLHHKDPLEEEMATHSSTIPWTEEPGGLHSTGLQRVECD